MATIWGGVGNVARKRGITDEQIIEMYVSGMSYVEMSSIIGIKDRAIRNVLVKHGIDRKKVGRPRIHQVNEHFVFNINYWSL